MGKTIYNGDVIKGRKVITELDVEDLEKGKVHEFFFETVENNIGQNWHIPITVIKGEEDGMKMFINAGIHGNELNPIMTANEVKNKIAPKDLKGTITIVHQYNVQGILNNQRKFRSTGNGNSFTDLNRQANTEKDVYAEDIYSKDMWNKVLKPNTEEMIDLHTGGNYPVFIYADYRNEGVAKMASLLNADIIKMDSGEPGSIETSFVEMGITALTFELGGFSLYEKKIVDQATSGILNYLTYKGMIAGEVEEYTDTFVGNEWKKVQTKKGGFVKTVVELEQMVKVGDVIAEQYDAFGNLTETYTAPVDGMVTTIKPYPMLEPGATIAKIIYYNPENENQKLKK